MKRIAPRVIGRVPAVEQGWFATAYAVLLDGSLGRLEATFDIRGATKARWEKAAASQPLGPWPPFPPETVERITTLGRGPIAVTASFPAEEVHAKFDRLPNGHWIVADARCGVVPSNARAITSQGHVVSRLLLGDGIEGLHAMLMDSFGSAISMKAYSGTTGGARRTDHRLSG